MYELQSDIAVIGGGLSGVCAALAAARQGLSVILAGDRPVLGGNSSSEVRMWTRGACGAGNLFAEEMGILGELKLKNNYANPDGNVMYWDEILLDSVLSETSITLLLNTHITSVELELNKIKFVSGFQLGSEREYRLCSKMFIDATGDGYLGYAAGVPFRIGQENKTEYNEQYAADTASAHTLGSSIFYYTKKSAHQVPFVAPEYIYGFEHIEKLLTSGGHIVDEKQNGSDYWWFEYGGVINTIADAQKINLELKKLALGVWNYIKNSGKFDAANLTLEWIGSIAGKRESRRMITDYVLTQTDITSGKNFTDSGFYGGWYLDFHPTDGIYSSEENCTQIPVSSYSIPLRTLFNSKCENLLFAGRIIGATHAAFASTRIMNTCGLSGQAAGILAACCIKSNMSPFKQVSNNIDNIKQLLIKTDMLILGEKNHDPKDLALSAQCSASSYLKKGSYVQMGALELSAGAFLTFPAIEGADKIKIFITTHVKTTLEVKLYRAKLPSRLCPGEFLSKQSYLVAPGENLLLEYPPQENYFITAIFSPNADASIVASENAPAGFLMGCEHSMEHMYPYIDGELGELYTPKNIINGYNRLYGAPNLWVSAGEKNPYVSFSWKSPIVCSELLLYFNPDLAKELPSSFTPEWSSSHMLTLRKNRRPPELMSDFTIMALINREWKYIAQINGNYKRLVKISLPQPIKTTEINFIFNLTPEQSCAQVFEIRIY